MFSTSGVFSTWGYDEYWEDIMNKLGMFSTSGEIMIHIVEQGDNAFQFSLKTQCTHDIPLMYL